MSEDAQSTWRSVFKLFQTTHLISGCVKPIRLCHTAASPAALNSLPAEIHDDADLPAFRNKLRTYFSILAYNIISIITNFSQK